MHVVAVGDHVRKVARVHRRAGNWGRVLVVRRGKQVMETPGRDTDPRSFLIVHLGLREQRGAGRGRRSCQKLSTVHSDSSPTPIISSHTVLPGRPDEDLSDEILGIGVNGNTYAALSKQWIENAGTVSRASHPSLHRIVGRLLHATFAIDILAAAVPPDAGSAQPRR